jgi:hypothetical protein
MEIPIATYTSFLNELQAYVLRDSDALQLYRQYLAQSARPSLVNHIDFYQDLLALEKVPQQPKLEQEDTPITYMDIYTKYFSGSNPEHMLNIRPEIIQKVRDNINKVGNASVFKSSLWAVIKELCFENLTNFTDSDTFQEFKNYLRVASATDEVLNLAPKERNKTVRLRKFFGEPLSPNDARRLSYRSQPSHVKTYRLNKRFGERVALEHNEPVETAQASPRDKSTRWSLPEWRTSRRLQVFFGKSFVVEDVLFSERIRAPYDYVHKLIFPEDSFPTQPSNVHPHRLNRFFGERVQNNTSQRDTTFDSDDSISDQLELGDEELESFDTEDCARATNPSFISSRLPQNQRIRRFFGERMDPNTEATYKTFAGQPANVTPLKLKKIFGTTEAAVAIAVTDSSNANPSGPTTITRRAHKLHKFFGMKVGEGSSAQVVTAV